MTKGTDANEYESVRERESEGQTKSTALNLCTGKSVAGLVVLLAVVWLVTKAKKRRKLFREGTTKSGKSKTQ